MSVKGIMSVVRYSENTGGEVTLEVQDRAST